MPWITQYKCLYHTPWIKNVLTIKRVHMERNLFVNKYCEQFGTVKWRTISNQATLPADEQLWVLIVHLPQRNSWTTDWKDVLWYRLFSFHSYIQLQLQALNNLNRKIKSRGNQKSKKACGKIESTRRRQVQISKWPRHNYSWMVLHTRNKTLWRVRKYNLIVGFNNNRFLGRLRTTFTLMIQLQVVIPVKK